ncbi:MAG: UDP-N-acetylmuramoyl-L-alanine--D-glutamate ligase [Alphaproteobacteria bacterium]|nr:UDP-N-acetylmuramoyl-L-alanine--D-glutamate ligase [Alphaproteobacteria bacterium]
MKKEAFTGKKTYLWGTGTEGQAILSWWNKNFPQQTLGIIENNAIPQDAEIIIKSPGVSSYLPQVVEAKNNGIQFTSMMNIFLANLKVENRPKIIAITGTKGKSTSASMMAEMLEKMGFKVGLGGNIGIIPLDFLEQELDYIVLELSSFQIYDITYPLLDYVTITNISQAHTDWHLTYENYKKDKLDIIKLAKYKILNYHDDYLRQAKADNITYYNDEKGFWVKDGKIFEGKEEIALPKLNVFGDHNLSNICGLLTILKMLGLDYKKAVMFLADYHPLDHRLQKIHEKNGLIFINDSIATVADSVIAGVNAFKEDVALIVGGYDNGPDYFELNKFIANEKRIKIAICLPDTGRMLTSEKCVQVNTMREAVECAVSFFKEDKGFCNQPSDKIILLSPAAPSFNMYKNYKERGEDFAKLAKELC